MKKKVFSKVIFDIVKKKASLSGVTRINLNLSFFIEQSKYLKTI